MATLDYCGETIKTLDDITKNPGCGTDISSIDQIINGPTCDTQIEDLDDVTGLMRYHEPSGKHICQLDDAALLQKNDCFLLTKTNQPALSSNKCLYSTFEARSFEDIMDGISVRTMAWKDKHDYSLTSHLHDDLYSRVVWIPNARYQGSSNLAIGTMEIVTSCDTAHKITAKINVPVINPPLPPEPMIGTFKFVSANAWAKMASTNGYSNAAQINPYDSNNKIRDDFDGWVWANGSTIENKSSQLSAASKVFANGSTTANFVVPDFSRFFKANPKTQTSYSTGNSYSVFSGQLGMPSHTHTSHSMVVGGHFELDAEAKPVVNNTDCDETVDSEKSVDENSKRFKGFHNGNYHTEQHTVNATIQTTSLSFPAVNTTLTPSSATIISESNQPYPKHNVIPVMVYIGGVTRKYFERANQS